jgi:hypothetical protein
MPAAYSVTCIRSPASARDARLGCSRSLSASSSPSSAPPAEPHLVLGRVSEGEPEQLVVGEALERGLASPRLARLSLVEQELREHVPLFPGDRAFPCLLLSDARARRT